MNRLILVCAIAVSMIFVAFGVSQGTVSGDSGDAMLVLLPGIALAILKPGKGCALRGCKG
ncbi:hypothetical protein [Qipengyuania soli]|uniref:Uncharacterized protein n=1 Tax=Qipengyuania soli TaxID=2782568 RepID=A0A7S8F476_9SPHN|nr:hypothetical protein [Qipengyuania soli]QPC98813.1 hypothetical protein IRL76_13415 [Qipengyuania soli]